MGRSGEWQAGFEIVAEGEDLRPALRTFLNRYFRSDWSSDLLIRQSTTLRKLPVRNQRETDASITVVGKDSIDWYADLRVFVYGTLKPGSLYWAPFCEGRVLAVREARVCGRLYGLDPGYPAARLGGPGWIQGVILDLAGPEVLREMDRLEGFDPGRRETENEYTRRLVEVFDPDGGVLGLSWIYEMDADRIRGAGGKLIPEGVWES